MHSVSMNREVWAVSGTRFFSAPYTVKGTAMARARMGNRPVRTVR